VLEPVCSTLTKLSGVGGEQEDKENEDKENNEDMHAESRTILSLGDGLACKLFSIIDGQLRFDNGLRFRLYLCSVAFLFVHHDPLPIPGTHRNRSH
jgi:hypothetical protein